MPGRILLILTFILCQFCSSAQNEPFSNLRHKNIPVLETPQKLDSLTVIPESVILINPETGDTIPPKYYSIHNNRLILPDSLAHRQPSTVHHPPSTVNRPSSTLLCQYRVLPYNLSASLSHFDTTQIQKDESGKIIGITYDPYSEKEGVFAFQKGLDYSGSFARGLSFGNNQNLVLNSSFNLQMAGSLGDDMEVLAAITDNNIPLQPEGNTQQLSEFDKIFIQITKDNNKLIAGDYELTRPNGYFMNYFKKLQGGTFSRRFSVGSGLSTVGSRQSAVGSRAPLTPKGEVRPQTKRGGPPFLPAGRQGRGLGGGDGILNTQASIAVARGKFARNTFLGQEGNQGPYRLEGAEGERFIIILAGTEKVWVDGVIMTRGLEEDYVIDYNAGHITFTRKRLITKDKRIIIEFDYADQNYLRSLYALNLEYRQTDKLRLYFNLFSEQDGRQPLDDEYSPAEEGALKNAGDNPLNSVVSSLSPVEEFSAFRVLYKLVDSLGFDSVLVFSTDTDEALYSAFFSFVGAGNGDYALDAGAAANGRVYRWLAPDIQGDTIVHLGEYSPVRQLISPKRQQLYTLGMDYRFSEKSRVKAELALSNFDLNRLSNVNDNDNVGLAAFTSFENVFELGKQKNWRLETEAGYEHVQARFRELNPYRPAEFQRDWNIRSDDRVTEHIARGGFQLKSKNTGQLGYNFSGFFRDSIYTGTKHFGRYVFNKKGYEILLEGNLLNVEGREEKSRFSRPKFNVGIPFFRDSTGLKYWKSGIYGEREKNERFSKTNNEISDTLSVTSFWYDVFRLYVESPESEKFNFQTNFQRRLDYAPLDSDFEQTTIANELNLSGSWNPRWTSGKQKRRHLPAAPPAGRQGRRGSARLGWDFTYRQLDIKNDNLTNEDPAETYLGRLNYALNLVNGVFQTNTSYEIGSGQERKSEFIFLPVRPGEGTFVWRNDDNGDGIIQQDEVEVAPFRDSANVLRQVVFSDEFIRTNNILFNQSLRIEPRAIWFGEKKGFKKFLGRFSTSSSLQITRKVKDTEGVSPWNPFQLDIIDTSLVATRSGIRNVLIFNANDPKFSAETGMTDNQDKVVLTTGFESRRREEQFFKIRWNITKTINTKWEFTTSRRIQDSEQFDNKDYNIRSFKLQPELTWLPVKTFRTILTYQFDDSRNTLAGADEFATTHDLKLEMRYNRTSKTSVQSGFSFVKINFNGQANSPVGFAFLKGLQNGNNFLWDLTIDRQLARNMRMSLSYEGRKTGSSRVVHVGRASVAATF